MRFSIYSAIKRFAGVEKQDKLVTQGRLTFQFGLSRGEWLKISYS